VINATEGARSARTPDPPRQRVGTLDGSLENFVQSGRGTSAPTHDTWRPTVCPSCRSEVPFPEREYSHSYTRAFLSTHAEGFEVRGFVSSQAGTVGEAAFVAAGIRRTLRHESRGDNGGDRGGLRPEARNGARTPATSGRFSFDLRSVTASALKSTFARRATHRREPSITSFCVEPSRHACRVEATAPSRPVSADEAPIVEAETKDGHEHRLSHRSRWNC
jgi:hypothetical protein